MPAPISRYTFVRGVRDWTLVLGFIGVTVWSFTLPDLPDDPAVRRYLNTRAERQTAQTRQADRAGGAALESGPATNAPADNSPHIPLIDAIKGGDLDEMQRLIAQEADINATDADGNTPLIWAVRTHNVAAVKLLLAQPQIDLGSQNHDGTSAYALAYDNEEIAALLKASGAVQ